MKPLSDIPFSVLDLSPIRQGGTAAEAFRNTLDLARHAERLGLPPVLGGRAPQHPGHRQRRDRRRHRPRRRRHVHASASGRAGSCSRTTPRWSSPSSSARWSRSSPAGSTWASAAPPAATSGPPAPCAGTSASSGDTFPQDLLELMAYFRPGGPGNGGPRGPGRGAGRADLAARVERLLAPGWRPSWGCRSRSPPTSPRTTCTRPWPCTAGTSSRPDTLAEPHVMVGGERVRGRHRRGGAAAVHLAPAAVPEPGPRHARACSRRRSSRWTGCGSRRAGARRADDPVLGGRLAGDGAAVAGGSSRRRRRRTS